MNEGSSASEEPPSFINSESLPLLCVPAAAPTIHGNAGTNQQGQEAQPGQQRNIAARARRGQAVPIPGGVRP